jgi:hypothetical protein
METELILLANAGATTLHAEWRTRFSEVLRADPATADDLRRLIQPPVTTRTVQNIAHGSGHFGTVIQAGEISGSTFNLTPAPADHIHAPKTPSK